MAVIIVTFNSAGTIREAIASVRSHLPLAEIVVVDNGSTDLTTNYLSTTPNIRLVRSEDNMGFGAAVNVGMRATRRDVLLVLNPDARVLSAASAEISRWSTDLTGLLTCAVHSGTRLYFPYHPDWGWRRELIWSLVQWLIVPRELTINRPTARSSAQAAWVSGAAIITTRADLLSVGGFDERMFLYFEDVDLSRRFRREGLAVGVTEAVVVEHVGQGGSARRDELQIQAWALLSLLELVATWNGTREAHRAARTVMRILRLVVIAGSVFGRSPLVGARARAKAQAARVIRSHLLASVSTPPTRDAYPQAREAVDALH